MTIDNAVTVITAKKACMDGSGACDKICEHCPWSVNRYDLRRAFNIAILCMKACGTMVCDPVNAAMKEAEL